jgi:hypothetical protein
MTAGLILKRASASRPSGQRRMATARSARRPSIDPLRSATVEGFFVGCLLFVEISWCADGSRPPVASLTRTARAIVLSVLARLQGRLEDTQSSTI